MSEQLLVIGLGIGDDADDAWFGSGLGDGVVVVEPVDTVPVGTLPGTSLTRCQFTRGARSITVDAPAERRWAAPITGEAGEAVIRVPRESAAASTDYIAPNGGSLVSILSEGDCGIWSGVVVDVDDSDPHVLTLTAYQPWKLIGQREVDRSEYVMDASAGLAASVLLREALAGVDGLTIAQTFEGGTLDGAFRLRGNAWSGVTTLMDASDGELHITANGVVQWCGVDAYANRYDTLLIAESNLQGVSYTTSIQQRVSEVTSGEGRDVWVARDASAAVDGWPAQTTVDGGPDAAQRELEARSRPVIAIEGGVTSEHWSIRERDYVSVLVPRAGFGGRIHRCRVLARSLADGDHLMRLELQVIQPVASSAVATRSVPRPPQRANANATAGSFAQVFGMLVKMAGEMAYKAKFEAENPGTNYDQMARIWERRGVWPSNIPRF